MVAKWLLFDCYVVAMWLLGSCYLVAMRLIYDFYVFAIGLLFGCTWLHLNALGIYSGARYIGALVFILVSWYL